MNKSVIFISLAGLVIFTVGFLFIYNYFDSVELTITSKNTSSYAVIKSNKTIHSNSSKHSETIRVPKFSTLTIHFVGQGNYETNNQTVTMGSSPKKVEVNPYYSKEYLASLAEKHSGEITDALNNLSSTIPQYYEIKDITLHHFADWASAKLVWRGAYRQNTDTLRVILKKTNGKWTIPGYPSIVFFYKDFSNIPVDILRTVNNS